MRRNVVLTAYNRATYDKTQAICRKNLQPKVSFVCGIYHTSKHFFACSCYRTPLLKGSEYTYTLYFSLYDPKYGWTQTPSHETFKTA